MSVNDPNAPAPQAGEPNAPEPAAPEPAAPEPNAPEPNAPDPTAPAAPEPAAPSAEDWRSELEGLRSQIAELESKTSSGQLSVVQTDQELSQKVEQLRQDYAEWPKRDDTYAEKPQPWDLGAHELPQPGVTRDHLPGGQPDEISPVVVAHNKPLLTTGMAGDYVRELADLLHTIGYETSISRGENHPGTFDDTVAAAVNTFKRDYHVLEDPTQWPQDPRAGDRYVGPYVWEALLRASKLTEQRAAA